MPQPTTPGLPSHRKEEDFTAENAEGRGERRGGGINPTVVISCDYSPWLWRWNTGRVRMSANPPPGFGAGRHDRPGGRPCARGCRAVALARRAVAVAARGDVGMEQLAGLSAFCWPGNRDWLGTLDQRLDAILMGAGVGVFVCVTLVLAPAARVSLAGQNLRHRRPARHPHPADHPVTPAPARTAPRRDPGTGGGGGGGGGRVT